MNCQFISEKNLHLAVADSPRGKYKTSQNVKCKLNLSKRFQESLRCFGVKYSKTLKWLPKIEGKTENFRTKLEEFPFVVKKIPEKSGARITFNPLPQGMKTLPTPRQRVNNTASNKYCRGQTSNKPAAIKNP